MFKPKKMFGQNFLIDKNIAAKIANLADIKKGDLVWEIGPGKGILTDELLKKGCQLTCFEIDRDLIPLLSEKYGDKIYLVAEDVLRTNWDRLLAKTEQSKSTKHEISIVANIPYNITSPLLYKVTRYADFFRSIVIMVQKEFAERLVSSPGTKNYGVLSLKVQYNFAVKKLFKVPRHLFIPEPGVDSEVIKLLPRADKNEIEDLELFWKIVEAAFMSRRKTLKNNLGNLLSKQSLQNLTAIIEKRRSATLTESASAEKPLCFDLNSRGESLDEKAFIDLYHLIRDIS